MTTLVHTCDLEDCVLKTQRTTSCFTCGGSEGDSGPLHQIGFDGHSLTTCFRAQCQENALDHLRDTLDPDSTPWGR